MVSGLRLRWPSAVDEIQLTIYAEVGAAQEKLYASIRWMNVALVGQMPGGMLSGSADRRGDLYQDRLNVCGP